MFIQFHLAFTQTRMWVFAYCSLYNCCYNVSKGKVRAVGRGLCCVLLCSVELYRDGIICFRGFSFVLAKFRKLTISFVMLVRPSVCPSACLFAGKNFVPLDAFS
jgi:hypothetical protein